MTETAIIASCTPFKVACGIVSFIFVNMVNFIIPVGVFDKCRCDQSMNTKRFGSSFFMKVYTEISIFLSTLMEYPSLDKDTPIILGVLKDPIDASNPPKVRYLVIPFIADDFNPSFIIHVDSYGTMLLLRIVYSICSVRRYEIDKS